MKPSSVVLATLFVGLVAGWSSAQGFKVRNPLPAPILVSGSDIGFRIDGRQGDIPLGTFLVKVDGKWVPVRIQHEPSIHWGD